MVRRQQHNFIHTCTLWYNTRTLHEEGTFLQCPVNVHMQTRRPVTMKVLAVTQSVISFQ